MDSWLEKLVNDIKKAPDWNKLEPDPERKKPGPPSTGGRTRHKTPFRYRRVHKNPPSESMEIVQARTFERLHKCKVRLDWSVWDELYGKWRIVPTFHKVIEQPSPAAIHQFRWKLLNALQVIEKETKNGD